MHGRRRSAGAAVANSEEAVASVRRPVVGGSGGRRREQPWSSLYATGRELNVVAVDGKSDPVELAMNAPRRWDRRWEAV